MIRALLRWPTTSPSNGSVCAGCEMYSRIHRRIRNSTRRWGMHSRRKPGCSFGVSFGKTGVSSTCSGADYTYLNETLARHYGVPGVTGPGFRRVTLPADSNRGGLLTQGSILMLTSHPTATSPVLRGKWILSNLLNSPPPPPPANVPPLDESPTDGRKLTTREKVERHRNNAACASCHARIDPLGFALENFDGIGRWRVRRRRRRCRCLGRAARAVKPSPARRD